jgi:hypothetical protein
MLLDLASGKFRHAQMFSVLSDLEVILLDHQQLVVTIDLRGDISLVKRPASLFDCLSRTNLGT